MKRIGAFLLAALILGGCATRPSDESPSVRCAAERGWRDGAAGIEAPAECPEHGGKLWLEAYNLGLRHHEFAAELALLDARIETLSKSESESETDREAARRAGIERVRVIRELEAIRGAAQIRGWVD